MYIYQCTIKKKELERKLRKLGWSLLRQGGRHEIWTNGNVEEPVPRHPEINELLAKKILKKAQQHPGEK
ncbi:MAG: type II toxin-antitoxin system HicA family toxin [Bdellovibrionales bacterium]|nr:type II toxin-antitoxin system HicA family toxin [Bdellovibrionales bacterium]